MWSGAWILTCHSASMLHSGLYYSRAVLPWASNSKTSSSQSPPFFYPQKKCAQENAFGFNLPFLFAVKFIYRKLNHCLEKTT